MVAERRLITVADDFGLSLAVNEAVETAARDGILTSASLMVGAPFAADAVSRARRLGDRLAVGLHLVVVEGPAVLPAAQIPDLVDANGMFPSGQAGLGVRYAFSARTRRQLTAEIRAQFAAFAATGLALDHANAHKHMHLHPFVGATMIRIGREFGLRAVRVPAERPAHGLGAAALHRWTRLLRRQARRGGMLVNDRILGLADTGHMTPERVAGLLMRLPPGLTEMYFHPAARRDEPLRRFMPEYEHEAEFRALMQTKLPPAVALTTYSAQAAGTPSA